jgi:hypothetical protein
MNWSLRFVRLAALFLVLAGLVLTPSLRGASLNLNPPAITNDYVGKIALNIIGLAGGQSVRVRYYADLNTNGVIDPMDPVIRGFRVADGQMPMIGGATNLNVPGDMDASTNGQIQVLLDFPGMDEVLDSAVGSFVYLISDAQSDVPLATSTFTVAQKVRSQGIRGRLTTATGGFALTNVTVALATGNKSGGELGVTDANGDYVFYTPPGGYAIIPVVPGFVADQTAGFVNVMTNQFVTNNLALASGSYYIAGTVTDATNQTKGIGSIFVQADTTTGLFAGGFTDTNGNFALLVTPGQWRISPSSEYLAEHGYLAFQDGLSTNVVSASVSNINFLMPKATALIYGTLKDAQGHVVKGIGLSANDPSRIFEADGFSASDGSFAMGVLPGEWNPSPNNDALASLGYMSVNNTNVTLSAGEAVRVDFVVQPVSCYLVGRVVDYQGNPLDNLGVGANIDGSASTSSQTDGNGDFVLAVSGGTWNLSLDSSGLSSRSLVGPRLTLNVTDGVSISNLVIIALHTTAQISGRVLDQNSNTIGALNVSANTMVNGTNYWSQARTDNSGNYSFPVLNSTWQVLLDCSDLAGRGYGCPNSTNVTISGANGFADFIVPPAQPPQPLIITSSSLPIAVLNRNYQYQLEATGGVPDYTWSMSLGSLDLPAGMSLSSSGVLTGTPFVPGQYYFVVRVADSAYSADDQTLGLNILAPPAISGAKGLPGNQFQFTASGSPGSPTYSFQYSTDLRNWTTFFVTNAPNNAFLVTDPFATNKVRFYRVSVQ